LLNATGVLRNVYLYKQSVYQSQKFSGLSGQLPLSFPDPVFSSSPGHFPLVIPRFDRGIQNKNDFIHLKYPAADPDCPVKPQ
jgi:hypothetical protein